MIIAAMAISALAYMPNGNALLDWCGRDLSVEAGRVCEGYVAGVVDGINAILRLDKERVVICVPDGVRADQLADVVRRRLLEEPVNRSMLAANFILYAVQRAYPCDQPRQKP